MIILEKTRKTLEVTKNGHFALWEWGGGFTNTGDALSYVTVMVAKRKQFILREEGI